MPNGDSDDDQYGPPLPPGMAHKSRKETSAEASIGLPLSSENQNKETKQDEESSDDEDAYGPVLPPGFQKRPASTAEVQPRKTQKTDHSPKGSSDSEEEAYGPAPPPPKGVTTQMKKVMGPSLPSGFKPENIVPYEIPEEEEEEEDDDDGYTIGPILPTDSRNRDMFIQQRLEMRAQRLREEFNRKDKPIVRESWMTELPQNRANFIGLGPRQFMRRAPQEKGDTSVWTDTPADREKKRQEGKEMEEVKETPQDLAKQQRDKDLTEKVEKYNNEKRAKSLMDMHSSKLKKENKDKPQTNERRPFSRELDMQVNRFDEAQKASILKKAQQLDNRFSSGKQKFL
ncbi:uncharacterized protein LOC143037435 isoform X2 [Oratosquilla oratoria]